MDSNVPLVCFTTKYPALKLSKISVSSIDRNFKSSEYKTISNGIAGAKLQSIGPILQGGPIPVDKNSIFSHF